MSYPQSSNPFDATGSSGSLTEEGMRLLQAGQSEAALDVLSRAVEANPSDGVAYQYLGIARAKTGALSGSIAALQEAARLLPMNAGIQFNLGVSLAQAKQYDEARQVLARAQELDPQNPRIAASLANLPAPTVAAPAAADGLASVGGGVMGMAPLGLSTVGGGHTVPPPPPSDTPTLAPPQNTWAPNSAPDAPGGMAAPSAHALRDRMAVREPTTGERIGRGLGWGFFHAQWWTLLMFFWEIVVGGLVRGKMTPLLAVVGTIMFVIVFGITGAIMGLVMACIRAEESVGAVIGIVVGLAFLGLEFLLGSGSFLNIFFWFFTGRFVGAGIAARINQTIEA